MRHGREGIAAASQTVSERRCTLKWPFGKKQVYMFFVLRPR